MGIYITSISFFIGSILLITFLFSVLVLESRGFKQSVSVDCFLASRAAVAQLKAEKQDFNVGGLDVEACKGYFKQHLAITLNLVIQPETDTMIADEGNKFIKYAKILDYRLTEVDGEPVLISKVQVVTRAPFKRKTVPDQAYTIQTEVRVNYVGY